MKRKYVFIWGFILLTLIVTLQAANVALAGVASQSSDHDPLKPAKVVIDGNSTTNYGSGSCSATRKEDNPWWRLDMRGPYVVHSVGVVRRSNHVPSLDGAEIRIGDSIENNGNNNPRCAVITINEAFHMTFNCNQMKGRYVNIYNPGDMKRVVLCEVMVYATAISISGDNVATRGSAEQSSAPLSEATAPDKAIDGRPGTKGQQLTCASVPLQDNPWWRVDLRSIYRITAVSVLSIGDCCPEELNHAEVRIGFQKKPDNQRCAVISTTSGQSKYTYHCGIMIGRFVHVVLPGRQKNLTFCEIHVYGSVLENVALRGVPFSSSMRWRTAGYASSVVDGNQITTCSHVKDEPGQWVKLDLLVPYNVTAIQLAVKNDYTDTIVQVDNSRCQLVQSRSQDLITFACGGVEGRYVTVVQPEIPVTICELEIYSTWVHPVNKVPQRPPLSDHCSSPSCSRDYILVHDQPKTWFEAQTYCRKLYSDLATISNVQDMRKVVDMMGNDFRHLWIGLHETVVTWKWSLSDEGYYGDDEFRNWGEGEPGDSGVNRCAAIQHMGDWKNLDCTSLNGFLCFDGRDGVPQTKILVETPTNWNNAQQYCRKHHTDLVSVRNPAENQQIHSLVPAGKLVWIGLFTDSWTWSDGSKSTFRYWGEGNQLSSGQGQNCAHVDGAEWSVKSCNTKSMFLCYYFKKKSLLRIQSDSDISDPVVQQQILKQLEAEMKKKGISGFKMSWRNPGE